MSLNVQPDALVCVLSPVCQSAVLQVIVHAHTLPLCACDAPCSWRLWTRRRRQKAARLRSALDVYHSRLLRAAVQQWRWVQRSKVRGGVALHTPQRPAALLVEQAIAAVWPDTSPGCHSCLLQALVHRVFSTALDLWQEEVGVRLHERNHERLEACWGAWQLAVLEAQALRRQAILWNAAAAFR